MFKEIGVAIVKVASMEFRIIRTSVAVFALAAFVGLSAGSARAETLIEALDSLPQKHKRLQAAVSDVDAAREQVEVSWGGRYPNASIDATKGYEKQRKGNGATDTSLPAQNRTMTVTQRLVDFGSTNATIDRAQLNFQQRQADLVNTRQALLFEGLGAYLEVMRAARIYKFAQSSEANIKRQTELEDACVVRDSGFSTDVLQTKTQLAGAQARRAMRRTVISPSSIAVSPIRRRWLSRKRRSI
jgi:outer membrane protein TolC